MRRYLIVANQTLGEDELVQLVRRRVRAEPSEFFIVVPATPIMEMMPGVPAIPITCAIPPLPASSRRASVLAQERLGTAMKQLRTVGAKVDGQVGDGDPMRAVEDALKVQRFDEIIVLTLPKRLSHWLRQDLPRRLEHRTKLPVTHVAVAEPARR